jgi:hypothetical protein
VGNVRKAYEISVEKYSKETAHWGDLCIDGNIILQSTVSKLVCDDVGWILFLRTWAGG